jgi:hypothetical protein
MFTKLREFLKTAEFEVSEETAQEEADGIGYEGGLSQFMKGLEIEQEHGPSGPENGKFDLTDDDPEATAQIAAAHLSEDPEYYTKLDKMEKESSAGIANFGDSVQNSYNKEALTIRIRNLLT